MSAEKSPEWLPDGWIMEVRRTKSGTKYRYYTSPVSGYTFRTKREVLRYLNIDKVEGHASRTTSCCLLDNNKQLVAQVKDSPDWLPNGWILEIKTRMSGAKAGQKYKCYFDPLTGSRFYSKRDVFQYLKAGKLPTPSSNQKRLFRKNSMDNVLAEIQYSPDGLPRGWIKEIKFRKSDKYTKVRKDPYYTDPVNGYIFRSLKDVYHYIETGEVSKHAVKLPRRSISDMYSLEKESPPPISAKKLKSHGTAVRRCLFAGQIPNSDGKMVMEVDGTHEPAQWTASEHASQCDKGAELICLPPSNDKHVEGMAQKRRRNVAETATEESPKPAKHFKGKAKKEKAPEPATENLEEPAKHLEKKAKRGRKKVSEKSTDKSCRLDEHSEGKVKKGRGKVLKSAITKLSQPVTEKPLDEIPLDSLDMKQLELESEKKQDEPEDEKGLVPEIEELIITESNLLEPVSEKSLVLVENPLDLENERPLLPEEKQLDPENVRPLLPEEKQLDPENEKEKAPEPATENLEEPAKHLEKKAKGGRKMVSEKATDESCRPDEYSEGKVKKGRGKVLKSAITKLSQPVTEKPLDEIPLDSLDMKQLELENEKKQDEPEDEKGLVPEIEELLITESNLLEPVSEKSLVLVENPLDPENERPLLPEEKQLDPENEKSLLPEEKQSQPERGVAKRGSSKAKTKKASPLTCRSSRRLAGLDAVVPPGFGIGDRSCRSAPKKRLNRPKDTGILEKPGGEEPVGKQESAEEEGGGVGKPAVDWPESPSMLPFGDSWSDPCIEFAFKTLTSDIPVLEDTAAIEDYFQQHLASVQSSSPSATGSGSLTFGSPEICSQSKLPAQLEPPDKSHTSK